MAHQIAKTQALESWKHTRYVESMLTMQVMWEYDKIYFLYSKMISSWTNIKIEYFDFMNMY